MNLREQVLSAFRFEETRPVPYTVWYDNETRDRLNAYYGGCAWQNRIRNHILRITIDWEPRIQVDATHFKDVYGTLWETGEPVRVVAPALKEPVMGDFKIPSYIPFLAQSRTKKVEEPDSGILRSMSFSDAKLLLESENKRVFTVVGHGYGLLESAWIIRGYENFFADLLMEPSFAEKLLDVLLERHLELVDELVKLPCDGIIFSDDYGDQRGVNVGPELWRRFLKPRVAKLYERVHASGKMVFQHTCGNVFDIIPDLIDSGLDVLQSLQPEAMPVYEIKKRYGRDLRLWGGLGTQRLLPYGTPDEIRNEIRMLKQKLGSGGAYVFTSSKPIMKDVPIENAVAFIDEVVSGNY